MPGALPELEKAARRNNRRALEAIALLADRDQSATLTRVWRSGVLTPPNQVDATRYLAATMEVNPDAEQLLRALAGDPNTEARLLYAAVDGLANPGFPVSFRTRRAGSRRRRISNRITPRGYDCWKACDRPSRTTDLRAYVDQAKAELQARWAETSSGVALMRRRPNKGLRGRGEMCHDLESASKGGPCRMPRPCFGA